MYGGGNLERFTGVIDIPANDFEGGGSSLRSQFFSQPGGQKNRLDLLADLRDTPSETGLDQGADQHIRAVAHDVAKLGISGLAVG